jgi:branched-chain amino acid transport system substrate-binding protein
MIVAGASADEIWDKGYKNIFGLYARASRYSKGMLELALERGLTEVAIIHADDSFSKIAAEGTKRWASAYGLNIVMIEEFVKGRRNLINLAQLAQRSSAELLVVAGHFDESVDMRSALDQINWYPPAYYATIGPALPEYHETLGLESEHTFSSSFWLPNSNISDAKAFEMNFKSRYDSAPSYQAAAAYAAGQVLEEAVKLSGSLERSRISDALSDLDVDTVFGRYGVDQTGMQTKHVEVILQWQGGDRVIVWPKNHRTAAAHFR